MTSLISPLLPRAGVPGSARSVGGGRGAGHLVMVSCSGVDVGLVLVAAVRGSHALVWPVTDNSVTPSDSCVTLSVPWASGALIGWPEAEAGFSYDVLGADMGAVMDPATVIDICSGARTDLACGRDDSDESLDALARVCTFVFEVAEYDDGNPSH